MAFDFRTKLKVSPHSRIAIEEAEYLLSRADGTAVKLSSLTGDPINGATELLLSGGPYDTADAAKSAGMLWHKNLGIAFAQARAGVNFGPQDSVRVSPAGSLAGDLELSATAALVTTADKLKAAIDDQEQRTPSEDDRHDLAAEFFHASFFESNKEARLIFLVTAVEAILTIEDRSTEVVKVIDSLKPMVKSSDLFENDKNALYSALGDAKKQSITSAGVELAERLLAGRKYGDGQFDPGEFFKKCYAIRSTLVHGKRPRTKNQELPTLEEVDWLAANLEVFVSDLLIASLNEVSS